MRILSAILLSLSFLVMQPEPAYAKSKKAAKHAQSKRAPASVKKKKKHPARHAASNKKKSGKKKQAFKRRKSKKR